MKNSLILFAALLFASCNTSITSKLEKRNYQKLPQNIQTVVIDKGEALPLNSEFIGYVRVGDTGFTRDCGYNKVVDDATLFSRSTGANILQITEVKEPSVIGSTCYRLKAKFYRNLDSTALASFIAKRELKNKSRLPDDSDYALVHFYRPSLYLGALLTYKIKDSNDSIVGRVRNGEKFVFKTKKFGMQSFSGSLETTEEIKIDIEKGKEYFIRCGINSGVIYGRPDMNVAENYIGMREYDEMD